MDSNDHIKKIFSSKLKNFSSEVPPDIWGKIEAGLQNKAQLTIKRHSKQKVVRLTLLAAVASIVGIIISMFALFESTHVGVNLTAQSYSFNKNNVRMTNNHQVAIDPIQALYMAPSTVSMLCEDKRETFAENDAKESIDTEFRNEDLLTEIKPLEKDDAELKKAIAEFEKAGKSKLDFEDQNKDNKSVNSRNNASLSLGASSGLIAMTERVQKGASFARSGTMHSVEEQVFNSDKLLGAMNKLVEMEHNQPISIGLSINKKITKNISLESGVVFTYLSSKIQSNPSPDYERYESQHFYYLGVPLLVNYKFAQWSKAKFYASAGGMIQKDVYGKFKGDQNIVDLKETNSSIDKKVSQKYPQLSINSAIGVSYPIYKKLSIYSTIGAAYYFDNNNRYRTIYQDKKIQLDLNLGMKFEL